MLFLTIVAILVSDHLVEVVSVIQHVNDLVLEVRDVVLKTLLNDIGRVLLQRQRGDYP